MNECIGKGAYDKKGAATVINIRWKEDHVKLRSYNCPSCGKWHLTHHMRTNNNFQYND